MIRFQILGTPVGKGRPRATTMKKKDGSSFVRMYTPGRTVQAENSVLAQALPYKPDAPLTCPLYMRISAYIAIPSSFTKAKRMAASEGAIYPTGKPDADNLGKLICDALNGVFYADDKQIVTLYIYKRYTALAARTVVEIRDMDDPLVLEVAL